jgi:type IV pilus assembly protein PilQ
MKWTIKTSMIATFAIAVVFGFTAGVPSRAEAAPAVSKEKLAAIKSINTSSGEGNAISLVIKLSSAVTYTSYKTTSPLRLVIDFSQTTQGSINAPVFVNKGNFKNVIVSRYDTDAGVLTRMDIELQSDSEATISPAPNDPAELWVSFPKFTETAKIEEKPVATKPVEVEASPVTAATADAKSPEAGMRTLTSISAKNNTISMNLDGPAGDYKSFRLNKPERFVVDLLDVKSGLATKLQPINVAGVASARVGLYPDKTRIVFDAVNGSFPEASVTKSESAVIVSLDAKSDSENTNTKPTATRAETPLPKATEMEKPKPVARDTDNKASQQSVEKVTNKTAKSFGPASVEMIDFQVVEGISRVSVKVRGDVSVDPPVKSAGFVTLTIKNSSISRSLQRSLDAQSFVSPVLRITPMVVKNKKGNDTKIRIAMRVAAPFEFRQEGDMLYVDFKNPEGLTADKLAAETTDRISQASKPKASAAARDNDITSELSSTQTAASGKYTGRKVTLEFADAEVRKIFQLLAEVSNKNFVLGDDVTGAISLKLINVPWDQALDIILDTKELDKRESGNIVLIKKKGKFKSEAEQELEIKKIADKAIELKTETFVINYSSITDIAGQFEKLKTPDRGQIATDARTNKVIVKDTPQALDDMRGLLAELDMPEKQVMIEARIIVATSEFTRDFGVQWGMHMRDGSASFMGINSMDTGFGGVASAPPSSAGSFGSSSGVATGISFGTLASNIQLDLRLSAATAANTIKVIATPKIVTLNNEAAKIEQGQTTYVQTIDAQGKPNMTPVKATLKLDVTPKINRNNTMILKIDAADDSFGTPPAGASSVAINNRTATSKLFLRDGETAVIGGIFREQESDGSSGVPYLNDIPLLGNLFKSSSTVKKREELLIFITPKIINSN